VEWIPFSCFFFFAILIPLDAPGRWENPKSVSAPGIVGLRCEVSESSLDGSAGVSFGIEATPRAGSVQESMVDGLWV